MKRAMRTSSHKGEALSPVEVSLTIMASSPDISGQAMSQLKNKL